MAATAAKRPVRTATKAAAKRPVRKAASAGIKAGIEHRSVRRAAGAALTTFVRRAAAAGADRAREAAGRVVTLPRDALEATVSDRPPVQAAVDVAVPLPVAWSEWMTFDAFTEGTHRIEDVERDGESLYGRIAGGPGGGSDWEAEIVDEREHESFAWRSVEGTDCAGLVTFHSLSERLTRIELDLDVLPKRPIEALALATGLPARRAERVLRRFKARVEFINPDAYAADGDQDGAPGDADD